MRTACRENSSGKRRETTRERERESERESERERNEMEGSGARIKRNARFILELKYLRDSLAPRRSFAKAERRREFPKDVRATGIRSMCCVVRWRRVNKKHKTEKKYIKATENGGGALFNIKQSCWVKDRWKRGSSSLRSRRSPRKREFARRGKRVGKSKVEREICPTASR